MGNKFGATGRIANASLFVSRRSLSVITRWDVPYRRWRGRGVTALPESLQL